MLSITASRNADAASIYFRDNLSQGEYYGEKSEVTGKWHGKGSLRLGLSGKVKKKDFEALLYNVDPNSGDRLTARNSVNRRPMYDFTWNAPKSVSIALAITRDQDILEAHKNAVHMAMLAVEQDCQTQVGTGKEKHYEASPNLIFAEFVHQTTRPLKQEENNKKEFIPDPHLHSHAAVINATFFDAQNRWRAVEFGNVKAMGAYYESLYHSFLGEQLKQAGYSLSREGKRWEISGISKDIRDKYSGRTKEIEKEAERRKLKTAKAKAQLGRYTREDKSKSVENSALPDIWKDRLSLSEYHAIISVKGSGKYDKKDSQNHGKIESSEKAIELALEHHLERQSGVAEKKLLSTAIDLTSGEISPSKIQAELDKNEDIISTERRTVTYISTRQILAEEERMIERASAGKATSVGINPRYKIEDEKLNSGQREAIEHALGSGDKTIMISGDAGTGKTTLLQHVKAGIEDVGLKLFAFAPTSDASRGQLQDKGFEGAETVAKLLTDQDLQTQVKGNVILMDEAGLVSVPQMNDVMDVADRQGCRLILSGDYKQHSSVERGDATRLLETHSKLPVVRVNEIVRQRENEVYKKAIETAANGVGIKDDPDKRRDVIEQAFNQLDQNGNIIEIEDLSERHEQIANDYAKGTEKSSEDVLVVAPSHGEGKDITEAIRAKLKADKRIGAQDKEFKRLQSTHLTGAEKQLVTSYEKGDFIEFHQNIPEFMAGKRHEVVGKDDKGNVLVEKDKDQPPAILPLDQHENFQVYNEEPLKLTELDRLRITKNLKSREGHLLSNGQVYDVKGFTEDNHIRLSNDQTLDKDARHFDTGYYRTSHGAQGKDAPMVLVAQSSQSFGASNDKQFYTSISRGIEQCKVYTDDKEMLKENVTRPGDRLSAKEIAENPEPAPKKDTQKENQYMHMVRTIHDQKVKTVDRNANTNYEQRRQPERPMGKSGFEPER